jgi:transcriptional regulator with XRE-family HTH domain
MNQSKVHTQQEVSPLRQIFARNVRLVRTHANLSQEAMADLAELDRAFVGTLERGTRNISIDNIERIAKALKEEPHVLMRPDLPKERGLDPALVRSPRTTRLYPAERKPRKTKEQSDPKS